jgi:hypothetical protein
VLDALSRKPTQVLRAAGQPVTHPLQLRQREQTRGTADRFASHARNIRRRDVRKPIGDDRRAFTLEPCDLRPQRAARVTLTNLDPMTTIRNGDIADL